MISISQLSKLGYSICFSHNCCYVQDSHSNVIGRGSKEGGLYFLEELHVPDVAASSIDLSSFRISPTSSSFYLWHFRLGHVSAPRLRFLASTGALGNLHAHDISDCSGCKLAKFSALPFPKSITISHTPFDLIHSDVWGPAPVATKGGSRYYVSFIDDCTRFCWVYLMKQRSEFSSIFKQFRALI